MYATSKGNLGNEYISIVHKFSSHIQGRCRRGGQSALRFDRLRDDSEAKYIKKAIEKLDCITSQNCDMYIIGGKANIKNMFGQQLNIPILGYINTSVGLEQGLYETIDKSREIRDKYENKIEYESMEIFHKKMVENTDLLVFGVKECLKYINYGMIDTVIAGKNIKDRAKKRLQSASDQFSTKYIEIKGITGDGDAFCQNYKVVGILRYLIN